MNLKTILFTPKPGQTASALDAVTLKSLAKHAVIVGAGAIGTYLLVNLGVLTGAFHLSGNGDVLLMAGLSWILKAIIEYSNGVQPPSAPPGLPQNPNALINH